MVDLLHSVQLPAPPCVVNEKVGATGLLQVDQHG